MNEMMRQMIIPVLLFVCIISGCVGEHFSGDTGTRASGQPPVSLLDSSRTEQIIEVLQSYYGLKNALTEDNASAADTYARQMMAGISAFPLSSGGDSLLSSALQPLLVRIDSAVRMIVSVKDESCEYKRIAFKQVSDNMLLLVQTTGLKHIIIYKQYCPMAFNDQGACWLSKDPEIKNPYFGRKMLECGEVSDILQ